MIKKIVIPILAIVIVIVSFIISCQKNTPVTNNICDGLITDTAGTNDNAMIVVPNAFSPNYDGINDWLKIFYKNIQTTDVKIYDSSKNIVFSTTDINAKWIPKEDSIKTTSIYHYSIQATTNSNHKIGICGYIYRFDNYCIPKNLSISDLHFEDQLLIDYTFDYETNDPIVKIQCQ